MTVDRCQGNAYGDHNEGGGRVEGSSVGGGGEWVRRRKSRGSARRIWVGWWDGSWVGWPDGVRLWHTIDCDRQTRSRVRVCG